MPPAGWSKILLEIVDVSIAGESPLAHHHPNAFVDLTNIPTLIKLGRYFEGVIAKRFCYGKFNVQGIIFIEIYI